MARIFLQNIIEESKKFGNLPTNWNSFDLENFSKTKKLWEYQQKALKNAITVLWKYFEDFADYQEEERLEVNQERKRKFFKWYEDNGLEEKIDIKLDKRKRNIYNLLTEYSYTKIIKSLTNISLTGCLFGWQPEAEKPWL